MSKGILVLGGDGLVGSRFIELYRSKYSILAPTHLELDITDENQCIAYLAKHCPYAIINFAAYTDVGKSQSQPKNETSPCWQLNVGGVKNLYGHKDPSTFFVQISTDMVFSGAAGPYSEIDPVETDPEKVTWYGYTKGIAEGLIDTTKDSVLRLMYPVRAFFDKKSDYLRSPLKRFDDNNLYPLFNDQQVGITFIDEACEALDKILATHRPGVFHACSSNLSTPIEIISYLLESARNFTGELKSNSIIDFLKTVTDPTRYPIKGGLLVSKTEATLEIKYSTWQSIIDQLVAQWQKKSV